MERRVRISKRTVDAADSPSMGRVVLWDTQLRGFGLRMYASGRKSYVVKYRTGGRQRWFTIGEHGSGWTPEEARQRAKAVLRAAGAGEDPQQAKLAQRQELTVGELITAYLRDGPATKPDKRASTWRTDRSNLERHARPLLGRLVARQVTERDISRMATAVIAGASRADIKTGPRGRAIVRGGAGTAERVLSTIGAMYAWGVKHGHVDHVPSRGVRLPRRRSRERFLSASEATALIQTIQGMEAAGSLNPGHGEAIRLLMLTGARKTEILGLRWEEVDLVARRIVLPPERSKTGGRMGERRIVLNAEAVRLLSGRERAGPFVFPAAGDQLKHTVGLQRSWSKVREAAGLGGLRIHDLRHTFASLALANGASLPLIGKALGHSSARVTERYAHLLDDPVHDLAEAVGGTLAGITKTT